MALTTVGDVVNRARQRLAGSRRQSWNRLDGDMSDSTTSFTVARDPGALRPGSFVAVDQEKMYVVNVDGRTVTVERGVDSDPAAHSAGDVVEIDWRWFTRELTQMFGEELLSWPDSIFTVGEQNVTISATSRSVDLPLTRFRFPLRLRRLRNTGSLANTVGDEWASVPNRQYRIVQNLPTGEYPSGNALIVATNRDTTDFRLEYAQQLDLTGVEQPGTALDDIPVAHSLIDAAMFGVMWRALMADEPSRSSTASQPEPREASEVRVGDRMRTATMYLELRDVRLAEEQRRLRTLYPLKW